MCLLVNDFLEIYLNVHIVSASTKKPIEKRSKDIGAESGMV